MNDVILWASFAQNKTDEFARQTITSLFGKEPYSKGWYIYTEYWRGDWNKLLVSLDKESANALVEYVTNRTN